MLTEVLKSQGYKANFMPPIVVVKDTHVITKRNNPRSYCYVGNMSENKRLEEILNFFANFFKATTIKFKIANDKYEYYFHNNIEYYKFITLKQILTQYTNLISNLRLYRYKNLSSAKNTW